MSNIQIVQQNHTKMLLADISKGGSPLAAQSYREIYSNINCDLVVASQEPLICQIVKIKEKKQQYGVAMSALVASNLKLICENENVSDISIEFVADIFDNEPTWKILDFVNFFKWVKQGNVELLGNKITYLKLIEWKGKYNESIALSRERYHHSLKMQSQKEMQSNKELAAILPDKPFTEASQMKKEIGRMADAAAAIAEEKAMKVKQLINEGRLEPMQKQSHRDFFEPKI